MSVLTIGAGRAAWAPMNHLHEVTCGTSSGEFLKRDFRRLADQWVRETGMVSSISKRVRHPAYRAIIRMGQRALPMILCELRDRPDHWFSALREIAQESPVPERDRTDPQLAREAWLSWGKQRGLIE